MVPEPNNFEMKKRSREKRNPSGNENSASKGLVDRKMISKTIPKNASKRFSVQINLSHSLKPPSTWASDQSTKTQKLHHSTTLNLPRDALRHFPSKTRDSLKQKEKVNDEYGLAKDVSQGNSNIEYLRLDTNDSKHLMLSGDIHESLLLGDEENIRSKRSMKSPRVRSTQKLFEGKIPIKGRARATSISKNLSKKYTSERVVGVGPIKAKLDQSLHLGQEILGKLGRIETTLKTAPDRHEQVFYLKQEVEKVEVTRLEKTRTRMTRP